MSTRGSVRVPIRETTPGSQQQLPLLVDDDNYDKSKTETKGCSCKRSKPGAISGIMIVIGCIALVVFVTFVSLREPTQTANKKIPECLSSPWKPNEDLVGRCLGEFKPYNAAKDVISCAVACCAKSDCIAWQFRTECEHGPDVRIGTEKDGPGTWCHDAPPAKWQGQYLIKTEADGDEKIDRRDQACNLQTWSPREQEGQCFGLGDVRNEASGSAEACMKACCDDPTCGAWQWEVHLGCFYGENMYACTNTDDAIVFQPFVGRRKYQASRTYTDDAGNPVIQKFLS